MRYLKDATFFFKGLRVDGCSVHGTLVLFLFVTSVSYQYLLLCSIWSLFFSLEIARPIRTVILRHFLLFVPTLPGHVYAPE